MFKTKKKQKKKKQKKKNGKCKKMWWINNYINLAINPMNFN